MPEVSPRGKLAFDISKKMLFIIFSFQISDIQTVHYAFYYSLCLVNICPMLVFLLSNNFAYYFYSAKSANRLFVHEVNS